MASVTLTDLSAVLDRRTILDRISLDVPDGTCAAVVGPSGIGKSTLLRAIAGLVIPAEGRIEFDGRDMTTVEVSQRDIGMVFQSPALLPNRNVRRNVEFPLEVRHETADAIRDRVNAEARAMHIEHLLRRRPSSLSRGEQQLVQIARTMVRTPKVLLLDEPFAPLDEQLRATMRSEIRLLQRGYGVTTVVATNDPVDAMSLASTLVVLDGSPARVVQFGTTTDVYDEPATVAVAHATGPLWILDVTVRSDGDGFWLESGDAVRMRAWAPGLDEYIRRTVWMAVRPDDLRRDASGDAVATLRRVIPGGASASLLCTWGGRMITATGSAADAEIGTRLRFRVERALIFDPADGRRIV
ncbi:ABC transporter ATP-binding protein [Ilumatobacter sp.]|uniref:ABC transporter ATP-binding protein n=1 Tax=Ilumatobacter sp. TaxID=1967498 RepID=UPI003C393B3F